VPDPSLPVSEGPSPAKGPGRPELVGFAANDRRQGEEGLPLAFGAYVELLVASGVALRVVAINDGIVCEITEGLPLSTRRVAKFYGGWRCMERLRSRITASFVAK
jgi:hypothetical protein